MRHEPIHSVTNCVRGPSSLRIGCGDGACGRGEQVNDRQRKHCPRGPPEEEAYLGHPVGRPRTAKSPKGATRRSAHRALSLQRCWVGSAIPNRRRAWRSPRGAREPKCGSWGGGGGPSNAPRYNQSETRTCEGGRRRLSSSDLRDASLELRDRWGPREGQALNPDKPHDQTSNRPAGLRRRETSSRSASLEKRVTCLHSSNLRRSTPASSATAKEALSAPTRWTESITRPLSSARNREDAPQALLRLSTRQRVRGSLRDAGSGGANVSGCATNSEGQQIPIEQGLDNPDEASGITGGLESTNGQPPRERREGRREIQEQQSWELMSRGAGIKSASHNV